MGYSDFILIFVQIKYLDHETTVNPYFIVYDSSFLFGR